MTHVTGGCHCGVIQFEAEEDFSTGKGSNCSHCDKKGFMLAFLSRPDVKHMAGERAFTTYNFNRGTIDDNFCEICGMQAFGIGVDSDSNEMAAINLRGVGGLDRTQITFHLINGKDF